MKNKIKESETENIDLKQPEETEGPKTVVRVESIEDVRKRNQEMKDNLTKWNAAVNGHPYAPKDSDLTLVEDAYDGN